MKMNVTKTVTRREVRSLNLSREDLERLIRDHYGLSGEATVNFVYDGYASDTRELTHVELREETVEVEQET